MTLTACGGRAGSVLLGGLLLAATAWGGQQPVGPPSPLPSRTATEAVGAGTAVAPAAVLRAVDHDALRDRWGIEIQSLQLTAAGYMLDLRYRVIDPQKAAPLFNRAVHPVLVDEKTGAMMAVPAPPKIGALRSVNDPKPGRIYFMFFANPGHFIAKYSRVTVRIGDFAVSGLTVR
jgi:hypothetical protein